MRRGRMVLIAWLLTVPCDGSGQDLGPLFLCGGGIEDPRLVAKFVELAGGHTSRLVMIPTASADHNQARPEARDQLVQFLAQHGAGEVTVLHTRDRSVASSDEFLQPLREATGVWFWGGRPARLVAAYSGTELVRELHRLRERGGVVAGTSAGTLIHPSAVLRGDPDSADLYSLAEGFGFLDGIALDVHILERNRLFSMLDFLEDHPELSGVGIDEDTAIIVHDDWFEVFGNSYVVVYGVAGRPEPFTLLSEGDAFELKAWMVRGNCGEWSSGCIER